MPLPALALLGGGLAAGGLSSLFGQGSKVNVPTFSPVNLTASQTGTIAGNQANAQGAQTLASQTTTFNTDQIMKMLQTATGGAYGGIVGQVGKNLQAGLSGQLPQDVIDQIRRYSASVGQSRGYLPGSGGGENFALRNLGINSLQLTNQAMDSATKWLALQDQTFSPAFYSSANMFMSPSQRASLDVAQNQFSWQAELAKSEAAARPDPTMASLSSFLGGVGGAATEIGGIGLVGGLLGNRYGGATPSGIPGAQSNQILREMLGV